MPLAGLSSERVSNIGVAVLGALPLILPWGYWAGPGWLAAAGLLGWSRRHYRLALLSTADRWLATAFCLLG